MTSTYIPRNHLGQFVGRTLPCVVWCDSCQMLSINGVACHERGCPNQGARWDRTTGEWIKFYQCWECGCDVRKGDSCECQQPMEDEEV